MSPRLAIAAWAVALAPGTVLYAQTAVSPATQATTAVSAPVLAPLPLTAIPPVSPAQVTAGNEADTFADFGDLDLAALLDTEVVSASARRETIADAPAVIEVITPQQLRAWGASTLNEALRHVVGIEVVDNYLGYTNINARGMIQPLHNIRMLLLIDGIPQMEAANGSFHLEQVPINSVERIEVIRGPGAVLYGTNAFAGVINVITRTPQKHTVAGRVYGGTDASAEGRADGGAVWTGGSIFVAAQVLRTPQWLGSVAADPNGISGTFPLGETFATVLGKLTQSVGKRSTLTLRGGTMSQVKGKWAFLPDFTFESEPNTIAMSFADLAWQWQHNAWQVGANVTFYDYARKIRLGVIPGLRDAERDPQIVDVDGYSLRPAVDASWDSEYVTVMLGFSQFAHKFRRYNIVFKSDGAQSPLQPNMIDTSITVSDINTFAQVLVRVRPNLTLGAGARIGSFIPESPLDSVEDVEPKITINPRASVVWRAHERVTLKGLYGRAFRAPTLFELYANAPLVVVGNVDLRPEEIDTVELVLDARPLEPLSLRLDGFVNWLRHPIERMRIPNAIGSTTIQYANMAGQRIHGVELTLRYLPHRSVDMYVAAGFQEGFAEAEAGGGRDFDLYIDDFARVTGSGSLTLRPIGDWLELTPSLVYIGRRAGLDSAVLLDATVYVQPLAWLDVGVVMRNLTDKRYATPELQGANVPEGMVLNQPRTIQATLGARF